MPSQPTRAVIANNSHRLRDVVYAARYLNVLGFREFETRTQHLRARPFNEAFPHGLRGRIFIKAADDAPPNGLHITSDITIEIEGGERPACIAEMIAVHYQ